MAEESYILFYPLLQISAVGAFLRPYNGKERRTSMNVDGLNQKQVEESRKRHGSNRLSEQKGQSFAKKIWENLQDPMIRILCVALGINLLFAIMGETAWYEAVGIALAVVLAVLISTLSEFRNESAFQKLQEEASRIFCKVYRDGALCEVAFEKLTRHL